MPAEIDREELTDAAFAGILFSLNLPDSNFTRKLVSRIFGKLIGNVIDLAAELNQRIGSDGVQSACRWVAELCGTPAQITGGENIPLHGPVLLAANHPGYFDSTVLLSQVPRQDVKALVAVRYFNYLPNAVPKLIYTDRSISRNIKAVREAIRHLEAGGLLLIFPSGHNDPDPDLLSEAQQLFEAWSDSISLLLRKVPETQLVLSVVSGIVSREYLNHPIALIQPNIRYKQRVAELFQILAQFGKRIDTPLSRPRASFRPPLRLDQLTSGKGGAVTSAILNHAQRLLMEHQERLP